MDKEIKQSLLTFPCDFPIKIVGKNTPEFETAVLNIIRKHFSNLSKEALQTRPSGEKNYLAITVTVTAQSQQQLDEVYTQLSAEPLVIMAL